ncbi:MAG: dihydropteroate synthase [Bacteroidetes bacterium RIFOXYA12_FULL_35_11]|nr:MAG: dihydropteroate synthase [Bacteroidetes bacterium GWF2_35_48]OFY81549.1 MAG: dihydropteroate synthase [Bacteroidetes bacterium RIFOXYA12_FULL_35_11]OFY94475.1 MAG: dihydropteroate synthase [Bacteroidetes bacterium RIFOXYC12_FULL_35_7]OFY97863.1 MAG: dihydropteroate synthase [Bacteroidetes bacterium RIFOXYB2_FULL_35_7]HBX53071.1 dihydropteroate synthase [Bacteroidales bacterium]
MKNCPKSINCKGKLLELETPVVIGIINITPDSFYRGSRLQQIEAIEKKIKLHIEEGASIIDIGAFSSRPGAEIPDEKTEWVRLLPALNLITEKFQEIIFSLDTFRSSIAEKAVSDFNISIINDISAGNLDPKMVETVAKLAVPYIAMHMQGTPDIMQVNPSYKNISNEIIHFFSDKISIMKDAGIKDIIIDPGFGFGKTIEHNFELLHNLNLLKILNCPILVGISRKATIYKTLGITPEESLNGTTVLNTLALSKGASILRVHDVKPAVEAIKLLTTVL